MKKIKSPKPCPFCGWKIIEGIIDEKKKYRIRCKSCKACTAGFDYWADAVAAWNRRIGDEEN
ncbi:MAG: Lar family restriction alleviation protein [Lachnospiraceae bacterium]|nr:Lar family restriction alleviation protein [Lachnospiraceae bacterium]